MLGLSLMTAKTLTSRIIKAGLCGVLFLAPIAGCSMGQPALETPTASQPEVRQHYAACAEDRREEYTTIEVPSVTQTRGVPSAFLQQLQTEIIDFGRQHKVWQVIPTTPEVNNVVVLALSVESWEPNADSDRASGKLAMGLGLIDKANQCEVGQTTGEGMITADAEQPSQGEGIRNIAQSAGWFVGTTLLHRM